MQFEGSSQSTFLLFSHSSINEAPVQNLYSAKLFKFLKNAKYPELKGLKKKKSAFLKIKGQYREANDKPKSWVCFAFKRTGFNIWLLWLKRPGIRWRESEFWTSEHSSIAYFFGSLNGSEIILGFYCNLIYYLLRFVQLMKLVSFIGLKGKCHLKSWILL